MDDNLLNLLRQLKLPNDLNSELENNIDFLFSHSEERLSLIEWFLKQAETALGQQILLTDQSGFSKLEILRLACVKLNLGSVSESSILKFLQCASGNRTLDLGIWEELSVLALSAQNLNSDSVGVESNDETGFGAKPLDVFVDNKRVLDQLLRVESFHNLFRTEAQFETAATKELNKYLPDKSTQKPSTENQEMTCEDILTSIQSKTDSIDEQIRNLENDLAPTEIETLNNPIETADLDSKFREIGDKIDQLSKAVEDFTKMYSATVRSCSSKQQMPKNFSNMGPASAALTKVHESFRQSLNLQNEICFIAEKISAINKNI